MDKVWFAAGDNYNFIQLIYCFNDFLHHVSAMRMGTGRDSCQSFLSLGRQLMFMKGRKVRRGIMM